MKKQYTTPDPDRDASEVMKRWIVDDISNPLPEEEETVIEVDPRSYPNPFKEQAYELVDEVLAMDLNMPTVHTPKPWVRLLFGLLLTYFIVSIGAFTYLYFAGVKVDGWFN